MNKPHALAALIAMSVCNPAQAWDTVPADVSFQNSDGLTLQGKLFQKPDSATSRKPAVILLHGCAGIYNKSGKINNIYREWGDRLNAAGYVALLVDSFSPRNAGSQCGNGAGVGVSEIFDRPKDVLAAFSYIAANLPGVDPARIAVLGWSHGASTVISALSTTKAVDGITPNPNAASKPIKLGLAFYAGCGLSDYQCGSYVDASGVTKPASCWGGLAKSKWDSYAPMYFFHGTADTTTKLSYCSTRVANAANISGGGSLTLTTYANAVHSFDDPDVGGGACIDDATTPNACAKQQADTAAMNALNQYLK